MAPCSATSAILCAISRRENPATGWPSNKTSPRSVRPEQRNHLARADFERHAGDCFTRRPPRISEMNVAKLEHRSDFNCVDGKNNHEAPTASLPAFEQQINK